MEKVWWMYEHWLREGRGRRKGVARRTESHAEARRWLGLLGENWMEEILSVGGEFISTVSVQ
jgi:hypothetical protein